MGSQPESLPLVAFGPYEFSPQSGELRKYGSRIRLQGQPLQILTLLVSQPGELITREELKRRLWGGETHVDYEQGLNTAVNKLRQVLGDSADQPQYIETLPGKGYRFDAPIQRSANLNVLEIAARSPARAKAAQSRSWRQWLPWAAVGAVAIVAPSYWLGSQTRSPQVGLQAARFKIEAPAGFALEGGASRQSFAISPDGSRLAFTAMDGSGAQSVFLRPLNSLAPELVPDSRGSHTLFWAPDGQALFYTARGRLMRTSFRGDTQVVLDRLPSFLFAGAWLGPGRLMVSSRAGHYTIPVQGGTPALMEGEYRWPQALPEEGGILFVEWDEGIRRYRAKVRRPGENGQVHDLLAADTRVQYAESALRPGQGYLFHVQGGNLLAQRFNPRSLEVESEAAFVAGKVYSFQATGAADFSVSARGSVAYLNHVSRSQLAMVDRAGRELARVGPAGVNVKSGRISPDGRLVAAAIYNVERGAQDLWIFDLASGAARKLSAVPAMRDAPVWSPDSARLAFMRGGGGGWPIVTIRGLGEGEPEEEFPSGLFQMPTSWSPDGRFVAFVNTGAPHLPNEAQGDVLLLDLERGRRQIPLLATPFHEANPAFSPDGRWLAFTSDESGRAELYMQAFSGGDAPSVTGPRYPVTLAGAQAVRWRGDGGEIYYLGFDGGIYGVPVTPGQPPRFGKPGLLFKVSTEARAAVHSVTGFDISADGRRFLIPVVDKAVEGPSIVVIQNWEAGSAP